MVTAIIERADRLNAEAARLRRECFALRRRAKLVKLAAHWGQP